MELRVSRVRLQLTNDYTSSTVSTYLLNKLTQINFNRERQLKKKLIISDKFIACISSENAFIYNQQLTQYFT